MEIYPPPSQASTRLFALSLCFSCTLYALMAVKVLALQLYNLWIAQPWCFRCTLGTLYVFPLLLCYSLMLRSAYYLPALKTFHNSILMCILKCFPIKSRPVNYIGQVRTVGSMLLLPHLQNAKLKPLVRIKSMGKKTSFMNSVVHDCQVDHSPWNYNIICLVRRLVIKWCWTLTGRWYT